VDRFILHDARTEPPVASICARTSCIFCSIAATASAPATNRNGGFSLCTIRTSAAPSLAGRRPADRGSLVELRRPRLVQDHSDCRPSVWVSCDEFRYQIPDFTMWRTVLGEIAHVSDLVDGDAHPRE
jgi:hypothetical protein